MCHNARQIRGTTESEENNREYFSLGQQARFAGKILEHFIDRKAGAGKKAISNNVDTAQSVRRQRQETVLGKR